MGGGTGLGVQCMPGKKNGYMGIIYNIEQARVKRGMPAMSGKIWPGYAVYAKSEAGNAGKTDIRV